MKKTRETENPTEPDSLYHYTTWAGLCGILESQSLWATHNKFTNDESELLLFRNELTKFLEKSLKDTPLPHKYLSTFIEDAFQKPYDSYIYLTSFCGQSTNQINDNGLLSQWRGYGQGGGFALEFEKKKLDELILLEREKYNYLKLVETQEVIYSDNSHKLDAPMQEIDLGIREMVRRELGQSHSPLNPLNDPIFHAIAAYWEGMCRRKHIGFKEENEFRIVAMLHEREGQHLFDTPNKPTKPIKPRERNGELIPYIALFESLKKPLPIKRIIVGPHRNKKSRTIAVQALFQNQKHKEMRKIDITVSDIPYVGLG